MYFISGYIVLFYMKESIKKLFLSIKLVDMVHNWFFNRLEVLKRTCIMMRIVRSLSLSNIITDKRIIEHLEKGGNLEDEVKFAYSND